MITPTAGYLRLSRRTVVIVTTNTYHRSKSDRNSRLTTIQRRLNPDFEEKGRTRGSRIYTPLIYVWRARLLRSRLLHSLIRGKYNHKICKRIKDAYFCPRLFSLVLPWVLKVKIFIDIQPCSLFNLLFFPLQYLIAISY